MCSVPVHDTVTGRVVLERSDVDSLTCAYACLRMSIYTHVITSAVTQMQKCRDAERIKVRARQREDGR